MPGASGRSKNLFFINSTYHINELKRRRQEGEILKFIFFWGHTPEPNQVVGKFCLSQWYPAEFEAEGHRYFTSEHYMMAHKALLFGDDRIFERILKTVKPGEAKALGREIVNFREEIWHEHKYEIVLRANYYKFSQHELLRTYLLNTQNRILAEASPVDCIWGVGLAENDPQINDVSKWPGENLLGMALMEVRDKLRNEFI